MDRIPDALLPGVFGCLSDLEYFRVCRGVCHRWRNSRVQWTELTLCDHVPRQIGTSELLRVCELHAVKQLACTSGMFLERAWPSLTHVFLGFAATPTHLLTMSRQCPMLEVLEVGTCQEDVTDCLRHFPRLKMLGLHGREEDKLTKGIQWDSLTQCRQLRSLVIRDYNLAES